MPHVNATYVIGSLITWLVARYDYKKAGDELREEARRLREQTQLILTALEQAGLVELQRDVDNMTVGFKAWKIRGAGGIERAEAFGEPTLSGHPKSS
jgi:hypothetical protein